MSRAQEPLLQIENLSISFFTRAAEIPAVMDFSCTIMPGEAMGLVGESGCGKSTVALAIMGDLGRTGRVVGGSIRFRGQELTTMSESALRQIRGSRIAMIYQEPMASLNPAMKIGRQLMEVPIIHQRASKAAARARARAMLEAVRLPDPDRILEAYPHQLSGGQQQRIVIAMALMAEPELLILDEPTTALDVTVEAGIVELVKDLAREHGTALLFISHNLGLVREVCDRITVMYSGEAVEVGRVSAVFERMRHPYTQALFRAIPLPGSDKLARPLQPIPGTLPLPHERPLGCYFGPRCAYFVRGRCDAARVATRAVPEEPDHLSRCVRIEEIDWNAAPEVIASAEPTPLGDVVVKVDDLKKYYSIRRASWLGAGDRRVVKANESVSFTARAGDTLAIVGESGCGKSTLAKVLLGLETATSGRVELLGQRIEAIPIEKRPPALVAALQMVFQNPFDTLNPSMTVGRQILRTLEVFGVGRTKAERRERMFELLDLVRLPREFANRMPRQLSGGQKQRVGIARAFAGRARAVVADEPVSALDVSVQAAVTELLMDIQRQNRTALLFISHDLSVVRYLADRVLVMYLGHVVEIGSTEQVFAPPYHPYTEALLAAVPVADVRVKKRRVVLEGEIPSAMNPPPGCPFQTRCRWKEKVPGNLCTEVVPPMVSVAPGHQIKCHLSPEVLAQMEPVFSLAESTQASAVA